MGENTQSDEVPLQFDSLSVHAGLDRSENEVKDVPIYASTSFVFNDSAHGAAIFNMTAQAFCYSRIANPTVDVFEKRMAALEGGAAALATASGEAALFITITALAQCGGNIVVASSVSDISAHQLRHRLPLLGISARFVVSDEMEEVQKAIDLNTKALFVESIPAQSLHIPNLASLATLAHENNMPLVVDNTAGAGGYLIRPIKHGADIVIQSAEPWISISGSNLGGIIVDSGKFPWDQSQGRFPQLFEPSPGFHGLKMWEKFGKLAFISFARIAVLRDIGPCLNPFEASMLLAGLETLSVRMDRVCKTAETLACWLDKDGHVDEVVHPGLFEKPYLPNSFASIYLEPRYGLGGGLLSFTLKDNPDITALCGRFKVVSTGHSIGGPRTVVIAGSAHSVENVKDKETTLSNHSVTRIYISVGLENIDDLLADFSQAFSGI